MASGDRLEVELLDTGVDRRQLPDADEDDPFAFGPPRFGQLASPGVERLVAFELHDDGGVVGNLLSELWMVSHVAVELFDEFCVHPLMLVHLWDFSQRVRRRQPWLNPRSIPRSPP